MFTGVLTVSLSLVLLVDISHVTELSTLYFLYLLNSNAVNPTLRKN